MKHKRLYFNLLLLILIAGLISKWRFPLYSLKLGIWGITGAALWIAMGIGILFILCRRRHIGQMLLFLSLLLNSGLLMVFGMGAVPIPFVSESAISDTLGGAFGLVLGAINLVLAALVKLFHDLPSSKK